MKLHLEFPAKRSAFEPGETIEALCVWQAEAGEALDRLELRVFWRTKGRGDTDVRVVKGHGIEDPERSGSMTVEIELPASPYSFTSKLITMQWGLELVAFPTEESKSRRLVIAPEGQPVELK